MNVLLVNTYDSSNGSARAAHRLHQGLRRLNVHSQMIVQERLGGDKSTILAPEIKLMQGFAKSRQTFESLPVKLYPQRNKGSFSTQWLPDRLVSQVNKINPDVINLHWLLDGYIQIETLAKLHKPLVWTLHDMWAFTGGCHYNQDCDRYLSSCGACPQLGSHSDWDLSRWVWQRKSKAWKASNLTIVSPSQWLAACATSSPLFASRRIEVIPNGLDADCYRPINQSLAREVFHLPQNKQLVLFGALKATDDKRKGFQLLKSALEEIAHLGWQDRLELVILGASKPSTPLELCFKTHYLDTLRDDISLALAYSAADLFIAPSLQDNLPNIVMESLACGTPVVAFEIGGMPDMIEHQKNGYLARPFKVDDLAQGLIWSLENHERYQKLRYRAREKVEKEFRLEIQAKRYSNLFSELASQFTSKDFI